MKETILIVEDQFVEADYLRLLLTKSGYHVCSIARSVAQAQEIIKNERPDIVLLDIFLKGNKTGIDLAWELQSMHIPFIYLSANSNEDVLKTAKATQPYGFLVKPFREKDLLITLEIARYRHEHSMESQLRKEETVASLLDQILSSEQPWKNKLMEVGRALQAHISFDLLYTRVQSQQDREEVFNFLRIGYDEYQSLDIDELSTITGLAKPRLFDSIRALSECPEATYYNGEDFERHTNMAPFKKIVARKFQMRAHLNVPVLIADGRVFQLSFYRRRADAYRNEQLSFIKRIGPTLKKALEKILIPNGETARSLAATKQVPVLAQSFQGIVGRSHLMLNVLDNVSLVAPSDTSVLILGESGTGKERIADCIHRLSPRGNKPFIKVNCAALPPTLIESELFGHEKGAFTGALDRRIGKFEQADKGTIFLDEVGELPLEFQAKLLRVLQEKEVDRIGSKTATRIDIRIVAATNRDLEKEVAEGRFRLDLYYRLNVFPIALPSLNERKEDIPDLAAHFIELYNRKTGKKIEGVSAKAKEQLMAYHWPGNIRELEHVIERSILLAKDTIIEEVLISRMKGKDSTAFVSEDERIKTIHENERDHILAVLRKCKGKIWGVGAAAELLNIPPSTLKSKMKKLGIVRQYIEMK
jgi:DNA-binding NtrC family response regulator